MTTLITLIAIAICVMVPVMVGQVIWAINRMEGDIEQISD